MPTTPLKRTGLLAALAMVILTVSVGSIPAFEVLTEWRRRRLDLEANRLSAPYDRYYDLTARVRAAARARDSRVVKAAQPQAQEILRIAVTNSLPMDFWNTGNALHYGNVLLGRIALIDGQVDDACVYLLRAGTTPGSPQLGDFGPDMTLADELLTRGRSEAVLEYLSMCDRFWVNKSGNRVGEWSRAIREGRRPDFGTKSGLTPLTHTAPATPGR
jgi:hypothetical protein